MQAQNSYSYGSQQPPLPPMHQQNSYSSNQSALPQTPVSQQGPQRPAVRPTSKSGFSFNSQKSRGSSDGGPKVDMHESPREKAARRLSTKADPRLAMSEAEPSQLANDHSSSLAPLRSIQHKDMHGNPIIDPDRSNPTRSRWERPLDTIRAFEAAIEGEHKRPRGGPVAPDSRRTSYYGGGNGGGSTVGAMQTYKSQNSMYDSNVRRGQNSYENQSGGPARNSSYNNVQQAAANGYASRPDSYYGNNEYNSGYNPSRQRVPRQASGQDLGGYDGQGQSYQSQSHGKSGYAAQGSSYESGGRSEEYGYQTEPSSDNSSFDRGTPYSPNTNYSVQQSYGGGSPGGFGQQGSGGYPQGGAPQPPVKGPMKLGKSAPVEDDYGMTTSKEDKKKSWFGKRFSKADR